MPEIPYLLPSLLGETNIPVLEGGMIGGASNMLSQGVEDSLAGYVALVEEGVLLPFFLPPPVRMGVGGLKGVSVGKLALPAVPFGIANPFEG